MTASDVIQLHSPPFFDSLRHTSRARPLHIHALFSFSVPSMARPPRPPSARPSRPAPLPAHCAAAIVALCIVARGGERRCKQQPRAGDLPSGSGLTDTALQAPSAQKEQEARRNVPGIHSFHLPAPTASWSRVCVAAPQPSPATILRRQTRQPSPPRAAASHDPACAAAAARKHTHPRASNGRAHRRRGTPPLRTQIADTGHAPSHAAHLSPRACARVLAAHARPHPLPPPPSAATVSEAPNLPEKTASAARPDSLGGHAFGDRARRAPSRLRLPLHAGCSVGARNGVRVLGPASRPVTPACLSRRARPGDALRPPKPPSPTAPKTRLNGAEFRAASHRQPWPVDQNTQCAAAQRAHVVFARND